MEEIYPSLGKWQTIDSEEVQKAKRVALQSSDDNLSELNNLGHAKIAEDFEDSPYADRILELPEIDLEAKVFANGLVGEVDDVLLDVEVPLDTEELIPSETI